MQGSRQGQEGVEVDQEELTFRGQRSGERLIVLLHQHPFVLTRPGIMVVFLLVAMVAVFLIFGASTFLSLAIFILLPVTLYIALTAWYTWVNTLFVLTDQRVMAVYQKHWFSRNVTETELENIVSIDHTVEGVTRSLLNYGNINIRSSGAVQNEVVLNSIYDPYGVQQKILDCAKRGG